jgi:protein-S-isoprenylcysteine O-methyltransferase Ste14
MRHATGIASGVFTHLFFAITVPRLFLFLQDTHYRASEGAVAINVLLAAQFAVPHSLLLLPTVRKQLTRWIASEFYGLFFTVVTCSSLWLIFLFWRQSPLVLWEFRGNGRTIASACFLLSWPALVYSLSLTGLGWQTGWTPWLSWVRGKKSPTRYFEPRGAYRLLRHPVYLSFLGLIWFSPTMPLDRMILAAVWTAYIYYGSYLKDERLAFYLGESYRRYQTLVSGYPGFFWGPLAKRSPESRLIREVF